jgi:branched-chain amino acid transport system substrate-binding protein
MGGISVGAAAHRHRASAHYGRVVIALAVVLLVSATGVSARAGGGGDFPSVDQPGVTDDEIRVGGVATVTQNPTGVSFGPAFEGVEAYFAYVNRTEGGIYGRRLVLSSKRDDALANNRQEVQGLISQDDVFAVLPVHVALFSGAQLLEEAGLPVFGWDIQEEWGSENNTPGPSSFFATTGSFICFTCAQPRPELWLARKLELKRVGVLAYAVSQSASCAHGVNKSFKKFPTAKVAFDDEGLVFGSPDYSAQVSQMVDAKVQMVIPCIDFNGAVNLKKEMLKQGLDAIMVLPNAYNYDAVSENAEFLNGSYIYTIFTPLETRPKPEGVKLFERWMKRTNGEVTENSIIGWINADLFVTGLKAAGPDFSRQKVTDAINQLTNYTANGLVAPVDWTTAHTEDGDCFALLKIVNGAFKPVFGEPGKPFICFPDEQTKIPKQPLRQ